MKLQHYVKRIKATILNSTSHRRATRCTNVHAVLESLEAKQMLSASSSVLANGVLTVNGTSANDTIHVYPNKADATKLLVAVKSNKGSWQIESFEASQVKKIVVVGGNGNDYIRNW
ncbi:MAG: hypothetical protein O2856_11475, partial [Planctomycetota bacterium]|nr:hypothetical protein [Planctomycetota bacterium]